MRERDVAVVKTEQALLSYGETSAGKRGWRNLGEIVSNIGEVLLDTLPYL